MPLPNSRSKGHHLVDNQVYFKVGQNPTSNAHGLHFFISFSPSTMHIYSIPTPNANESRRCGLRAHQFMQSKMSERDALIVHKDLEGFVYISCSGPPFLSPFCLLFRQNAVPSPPFTIVALRLGPCRARNMRFAHDTYFSFLLLEQTILGCYSPSARADFVSAINRRRGLSFPSGFEPISHSKVRLILMEVMPRCFKFQGYLKDFFIAPLNLCWFASSLSPI